VSEAYVGRGLVMKRLKASARGRASRIEKPFARITVIVRQVEEPA
jgi:large subunit ribosomal protein L22